MILRSDHCNSIRSLSEAQKDGINVLIEEVTESYLLLPEDTRCQTTGRRYSEWPHRHANLLFKEDRFYFLFKTKSYA